MKRNTYLVLGAAIIAILLIPQTAQATSAYVVNNHTTEAFQAWNINPDGTVTYQFQKTLSTTSDPAGIGIYDEPGNEYMYISGEFTAGGGLEVWDPVTHTHVGHSATGGQIGGVDVDTAAKIVYGVGRQTNQLHSWSLNSATGNLTYLGPQTLGGTSRAFSIALDEARDTLWVADYNTNTVRSYSTSDFTTPTSSFTPAGGHTPIDIAVDTVRNVVYTTAGWVGDDTISAYDVGAGTEKQFDLGNVRPNLYGLGIAVDETTGYAYMTTGAGQGSGLHEILVIDPSKDPLSAPSNWVIQEIDTNPAGADVIGSPGGLAIGNEVSYNPLNFQKTISGPGLALIGTPFEFAISLQPGTVAYHNALLIDTLPPEMNFVSATGGGVYDAGTHTVTWTLGDILANAPAQSFGITATWSGVAHGQTYTNFATIQSDELTITRTEPTTVVDPSFGGAIPEPLTMLCMGMAVAGLGGYIRKRRMA